MLKILYHMKVHSDQAADLETPYFPTPNMTPA